MFIIQQLYCLTMQIDKHNKTYLLDDHRIDGKKIQMVRLYTGDEDFSHTQPYSDKMLSSTTDFDKFDLYLSHTSRTGKTDYLHKDILNQAIYHPTTVPHLLNEYIDSKKSYIEMEGTTEESIQFPLYVFCQRRRLNRLINYTHIKSYQVVGKWDEEQILPLSQIVGKALEGKKIVRITAHERENPPKGYLNLIGKGERTIEMLPLAFIARQDNRQFAIDPINIDWEKSTLHKYIGKELTLTFFY